MSIPLESGRPFQLYSTGEPHPFAVPYQGLQYKGEVILSDQWEPDWGRLLEGDIYFRIVLLRQRRRVPSEDIHDSRIAVCIPRKGSARGGEHLSKELTSLRETQALYLTQRDQESDIIHSYLRRQQEELESQLASEEASRYSSGHIETPAVLSEGIEDLLAGPEPTVWCQKLGTALLSWAYPALPLDVSLLPRPLTPEDAPRIYEAIFAPNPEDRVPLGEFGPGLDLSKPHEPLTFEPEGCQVFQRIRAELENRQEELPWRDIHPMLAHAFGRTWPLATLYLLAFTYYGQPETELSLAQDHRLSFRDGRPIRGGRLTREFIPLLPWRDDPHGLEIVSLRFPRVEVSWNDALQYTSLLCQGLTEVEDDSSDAAKQEGELLEALRELAGGTVQAREVLETLGGVMPVPNRERLRSTLNRLTEVCAGGDFQSVYELARGSYGNPHELLQELDLVKRLLFLGESLDDIVGMRAYLDSMVIEGGYRQLAFDRTTLLEEMTLSVLLASAQGWATVRAHIREFQTRYRRAYSSHHSYYQREVSHLWAPLHSSRLKLRALDLLNSIPELGEPVGTELEQRYDILQQGIRLCDVNPWDIRLQRSSRCPNCQVALGERPAAQELELFLNDLDRSLGEQNRCLSYILVERILHDKIDQRLENFLKIVQASDLSALSNTLNSELVLFIRELVANP